MRTRYWINPRIGLVKPSISGPFLKCLDRSGLHFCLSIIVDIATSVSKLQQTGLFGKGKDTSTTLFTVLRSLEENISVKISAKTKLGCKNEGI